MADTEVAAVAATDMETEASAANPCLKREREEGDDSAAGAGEAAEEATAKKQKVGEEAAQGEPAEEAATKKQEVGEEVKEEAASKEEEEAAAKKQEAGEEVKEEEGKGKPVKLGPKEFASAVEMFDYFFALLHSWTPHIEINKYEHMVLEDLLKKGHSEPDKKIGPGVEAFEIRNHPVWQSRCFFVRRIDGSADDFSFRKCVDSILPLPENMKLGNKSSNGKKAGGHYRDGGGRGGGRRGRGRGRRAN